jgi:hypothetical protein
MAAAMSCAAYALMAMGAPPLVSTVAAALALTGWVKWLASRHSRR